MRIKLGFRPLTDGQHVKGSERVLKSAGQYFCDIF